MQNSNLGRFSFNGMTLPKIGPMDIPFPVTLVAGEEFEVDASQLIDNGWLDFISGVFIDNTSNTGDLTIRCNGTGQRFPFPATYAGYVPLMVTNPVKLFVTSTANANIILHFYNIPQFPILLPGPNTPSNSDVNIVAIDGNAIAGPNLPVEIVAPNPVPVSLNTALNGAYTNGSIALSGVSQSLFVANASRRILIVQNNGAAPMAVTLDGSAAVIGGAGSIQILAGGSIIFDSFPPTGAINIIGTVTQVVTAYEG